MSRTEKNDYLLHSNFENVVDDVSGKSYIYTQYRMEKKRWWHWLGFKRKIKKVTQNIKTPTHFFFKPDYDQVTIDNITIKEIK